MPHFIQLMHPGKEHRFNRNDNFPFKEWNITTEHRRKFIKSKGQYINTKGTLKESNNLQLWCEWEPSSKVIKTLETKYSKIESSKIRNYSGFPKYLHSELNYEKSSGWKLNTDPFIFGDNGFSFFLCRQSRKTKKGRNNTLLAKLDKGSVICFGSYKQSILDKKKLFLLDTVFVVSDFIEYVTLDDILSKNDSRISKEFIETSLRLLTYERFDAPIRRRLYFGATYKSPVNSMYSYVPCSLPKEKNIGFERPNIELPSLISSGLNTNFKATYFKEVEDLLPVWESIQMQVKSNGLLEGVQFEMPKMKGQEEVTSNVIGSC